MLRLFRTTTAAIGTVCLAVALTACSGESAGEQATDFKPANGALTKDNFAQRVGEAQRQAGTGAVDMDVEADGQKSGAAGDFSVGADPKQTAIGLAIKAVEGGEAEKQASPVDVGTLQIRLVDEILYANLGQLTNNKYSKLDINSNAQAFGEALVGLVLHVDSASQLADFDKAVKSFKQDGASTQIDGVKTAPFKVEVETAKFARVKAMAAQEGKETPERVTLTYYIGEDDLPRRIVGDFGAMTVDAKYSGWGKKVSIKVPPASQINPDASK